MFNPAVNVFDPNNTLVTTDSVARVLAEELGPEDDAPCYVDVDEWEALVCSDIGLV